MRAVVVILVCTLAAGASAPPSWAEEPSAETRGWHVQVSPYLWMASLDGDVATISSLPSVDVDAGFDDIIENTDFAFMMQAEVRHRRLGFLIDLSYLELSIDEGTPGPAFGDAEIDNSTFFITMAPYYRVVSDDRFVLDVLAGVRVWRIETELRLDAGLLAGRKTQEEEAWADPLIGARGSVHVWGPVSLSSAVDLGGFGAGSDFTWEILGTIDWQPWDHLTFRAGYRHLDVDYEDGGFEWDVAQSGPILGARLGF